MRHLSPIIRQTVLSIALIVSVIAVAQGISQAQTVAIAHSTNGTSVVINGKIVSKPGVSGVSGPRPIHLPVSSPVHHHKPIR